jgi:basic amino acid/polyamine antiporter, APA family
MASSLPPAKLGGDYVYISRTLHPGLGFVASWGFTCSQFFGIGVYSAWCITTAVSPGLSTLGYVSANPTLISLGALASQPFAIAILGTGLLGMVLATVLAGLDVMKRLLNALFLVALAGTLAIMATLLLSSHEEFVRAFNDVMSMHANMPNAYETIIDLGRKNGLITGEPTNLRAALLALPVGYWVFIGFTYSAYVGSEVKQPQKNQTRGILAALLVGFVIYMITIGRYYEVVGRDFNNAVAIVQNLPNSPLPAGGSMTFFAGILARNLVVNSLIGLSTAL